MSPVKQKFNGVYIAETLQGFDRLLQTRSDPNVLSATNRGLGLRYRSYQHFRVRRDDLDHRDLGVNHSLSRSPFRFAERRVVSTAAPDASCRCGANTRPLKFKTFRDIKAPPGIRVFRVESLAEDGTQKQTWGLILEWLLPQFRNRRRILSSRSTRKMEGRSLRNGGPHRSTAVRSSSGDCSAPPSHPSCCSQ